jgi:leucyl aminopeptidase (aminopeptidase T)
MPPHRATSAPHRRADQSTSCDETARHPTSSVVKRRDARAIAESAVLNGDADTVAAFKNAYPALADASDRLWSVATHGITTADFVAIRHRAEVLAGLWRRTREVRITSPAGTDLRATVTGREPMAWLTGICRNPGEVSALPGGEVSLPRRGTADGVVVWERVASDLGALEAPVTITVRAGRAVAIEGGSSAARLRAIVDSVVDADNIGEIGIGLNPEARIGDEITEAKKAFGTVHVALGDSANEYGGLVECDVHLDGLVMSPTIEFDGVPVVVDGRHVYELLA